MRIQRLVLLPLLVAGASGCAHGPSGRDRRGAEIHSDLGLEALRAGRAQDALREFDTAVGLEPDLPEANLGRGLVLEYAFGKDAEAEAAYRRAIAVKPKYSEAHNDLGQLLAREGRLDEALREFNEALDNTFYMEPWVARCNKGQALVRAGRRDEGVEELKVCLRIAPAYCQGRREFGRLLLGEGKPAEAVEQLEAYAQSCAKLPDAHLQLGLAIMRTGDVERARAQLQQCVDLGGADPLADECRHELGLLREPAGGR